MNHSHPNIGVEDRAIAIAIDVGAHVGIYSKLLSDKFDKVLTIDPVPENVRLLKKSLPPNCIVYSTALGSEDAEVELRIPYDSLGSNSALATVSVRNEFSGSGVSGFRMIAVSQTTGDRLFAKFKEDTGKNFRVSLIKIDVEGYEREVLRGFEKIIDQHRPIFIIEIERRHDPDYCLTFDFLTDRGYRAGLFKDGRLVDISTDMVERSYSMLVGCTSDHLLNPTELKRAGLDYENNFIFVPNA